MDGDSVNAPFQIALPFPKPPAPVRTALAHLRIARSADAAARATLGNLDKLPRPWEPAACPPEIRHHIWLWCDDIVAWINHEYLWRSTQLIPGCWPRHPQLAHEIPLLGCLRVQASEALRPDPLDDWHRNTLPMFIEQFTALLGESGCRTGRHQDWPAASRFQTAHTGDAVAERQELFARDVGTQRQSRPAERPADTATRP